MATVTLPGVVYVYTNNKGERESLFGGPRQSLYNENGDVKYTLFGIFLYNGNVLNKRNEARFRERWEVRRAYGNEAGDIGTSEGFSLEYESVYKNGEYVKTGEIVLVRNNRHTRHFVERHRERFQDKLKAINKKAKELMELGVERAAAIKAAKKCACKH